MKYRYFVSYFAKLNVADNGLGISINGHIDNGVFEISHPLTTKDEVQRFTAYLQSKLPNSNSWTAILLGFSLMYIYDENSPDAGGNNNENN